MEFLEFYQLNQPSPENELKNVINDLFKSSETRGKDCAGISFNNLKTIKLMFLRRT